MAETRITIPGAQIVNTYGTGAAALSLTFTAIKACQLIAVTNKFSSAPTTSENFTVTLDATNGAAYDVTLYSVDPSAGSLTSIVWMPDDPFYVMTGDKVTVAYTNTDTRTYGTQIIIKEAV